MQQSSIRQPTKKNKSKINLFCIPHAGGAASLYKRWPNLLSDFIQPLLVCLPGREHRINDRMPDNLDDLVQQLADSIGAYIDDKPWAIFGHSMGATLAHSVSSELIARGYKEPIHLILSAQKPPHFQCEGSVHLKSDQSMCEEIIRLGGTDPELFNIPELREFFLSPIRSDYKIIETWDGKSAAKINCPITIFRGVKDTELTIDEALEWQKWSAYKIQIADFPGGHFYLLEYPELIVSELHNTLKAWL